MILPALSQNTRTILNQTYKIERPHIAILNSNVLIIAIRCHGRTILEAEATESPVLMRTSANHLIDIAAAVFPLIWRNRQLGMQKIDFSSVYLPVTRRNTGAEDAIPIACPGSMILKKMFKFLSLTRWPSVPVAAYCNITNNCQALRP